MRLFDLMLISVLIPTFNRGKTIRYCLDSVLAQTIPPFEVIVIDDCSNDNTVEIVKSIDDSRVRCLIQSQNAGAQAARNRGISEARGEWIAFQDSDDEWLPDKLEKQVEALKNVDYDPMTVVHSDGFRYEHKSGKRTLWKLPLVQGADVFPLLLRAPGPLFPTILTSKAALEAIGSLDEHVPSYQEWDTAIRFARFCRFIHLRDPLFVYHLHEGETISKDMRRDIEGYQYIVDKYRGDILMKCGAEVLNTHLINNARKAMINDFFLEAENIIAKTIGDSFEIRLLKYRAKLRSYPGLILRIYDRLRLLLSKLSVVRNEIGHHND